MRQLMHETGHPSYQIFVRIVSVCICLFLIPIVPERPDYWDEVAVVSLYITILWLSYGLVIKML